MGLDCTRAAIALLVAIGGFDRPTTGRRRAQYHQRSSGADGAVPPRGTLRCRATAGTEPWRWTAGVTLRISRAGGREEATVTVTITPNTADEIFTPAFFDDPYPTYRAYRDRNRVLQLPFNLRLEQAQEQFSDN